MKRRLTYHWPDWSDALELVENARASDVAEVWALSRNSIENAVTETLMKPGPRWAARQPDGGLVCIFGYSEISVLAATAAPWIIGTDLLNEESRDLIRMTRSVNRDALHHYDQLWNVVWSENTKSIRYLKACGFTIGPERTTAQGSRYHPFTMERKHV